MPWFLAIWLRFQSYCKNFGILVLVLRSNPSSTGNGKNSKYDVLYLIHFFTQNKVSKVFSSCEKTLRNKKYKKQLFFWLDKAYT